MRVFTRENLRRIALTSFLSHDMRACGKAERCDESLYDRMYRMALGRHVRMMKEMADLQAGCTVETELEPAADGQGGILTLNTVSRDPGEALPFDETAAKQDFMKGLEERIRDMEELLPRNLLERIVDVRMLALGYCLPENRPRLKQFCRRTRDDWKRSCGRYWSELKSGSVPLEMQKGLMLHDGGIESCKGGTGTGDSLRMRVRDCEGNLHHLCFLEAEVLEREGSVGGHYWLDCEIYRIESGYEIHMSFWGSEWSQMTIRCSGVEFGDEACENGMASW